MPNPAPAMPTADKHTPVPWRVNSHFPSRIEVRGSCDTIECAVYSTIVECLDTEQSDGEGRTWTTDGEAKANAEFIVKAVNQHALLCAKANVGFIAVCLLHQLCESWKELGGTDDPKYSPITNALNNAGQFLLQIREVAP